jgi:hypothetical protein
LRRTLLFGRLLANKGRVNIGNKELERIEVVLLSEDREEEVIRMDWR